MADIVRIQKYLQVTVRTVTDVLTEADALAAAQDWLTSEGETGWDYDAVTWTNPQCAVVHFKGW